MKEDWFKAVFKKEFASKYVVNILLLNESLFNPTPLTSINKEIQLLSAKDVALDLGLTDPKLKYILLFLCFDDK